MPKLYLNKRILIGVIIAFSLLSTLAVYSYLITKKLISTSRWVAHTHDVLYNAERLLTAVVMSQSAYHYYVLSGNPDLISRYQESKAHIIERADVLQRLTQDNASQQQRVAALRLSINEFVSHIDSAILKTKGAVLPDTAQTNRRKVLIDEVRTMMREFEEEEDSLLVERTASNEKQIAAFNIAFISLLVATGSILAVVFSMININLKKRNETEAALRVAGAEILDLYDNAPCGYHSLNEQGVFVDVNKTLLHWLGYHNKSEVIGKLKFIDILIEAEHDKFFKQYKIFKETGFIHNIEFTFKRTDGSEFPIVLSSIAIYDEHGNFVKTRSSTFDNTERKAAENQIKNLNLELEAFSYSVSHDLRAPLRSIDGYARILREDYEPNLDDEGKRVIKVIINNARRMGQLIDDLLDFSRLGRKEIARTNIDMDSLVRSVIAEIKEQNPSSSITFEIERLLPAMADMEMIRQVWANFISNAVKYSSKRASPVVRISSRYSDNQDETWYSIADNGVGFDMKYGAKLFGVFQRLHKAEEFPGTGVGLAIVNRIVSRHQGRVWAEGVPDHGATFYFSLPRL